MAVGEFRGRRDARGYIYLLQNEAFKDGWVKIGKSRRSGEVRAEELNAEAGTGIPKFHRCVFQVETLDCDRAEVAVFERLKSHRQGSQEFFIVETSYAEQVIREECSRITHEVTREVDEANASRARELRQQRAAALRDAAVEHKQPSNAAPARKLGKHHQVVLDGIARANRTKSRSTGSPPPAARPHDQWVTPEQVAAAWSARNSALQNLRKRTFDEQCPPSAPAPEPKRIVHPEFKWIVLLTALLFVVAISI